MCLCVSVSVSVRGDGGDGGGYFSQFSEYHQGTSNSSVSGRSSGSSGLNRTETVLRDLQPFLHHHHHNSSVGVNHRNHHQILTSTITTASSTSNITTVPRQRASIHMDSHLLETGDEFDEYRQVLPGIDENNMYLAGGGGSSGIGGVVTSFEGKFYLPGEEEDPDRDDLEPGMSHSFRPTLDTMNISDSTSFFESLQVDKEKIEESLSLMGLCFTLVSLAIFALDTASNALLAFLLFKQKSHWFTATVAILIFSGFICNLCSLTW